MWWWTKNDDGFKLVRTQINTKTFERKLKTEKYLNIKEQNQCWTKNRPDCKAIFVPFCVSLMINTKFIVSNILSAVLSGAWIACDAFVFSLFDFQHSFIRMRTAFTKKNEFKLQLMPKNVFA